MKAIIAFILLMLTYAPVLANTPSLWVVPYTVAANTTATKSFACPTGGGATLPSTEPVGGCIIPGVPGATVGTLDNLFAMAETAPDNGAGDQAYIITFHMNLCIPSGSTCTYGTAADQDLYCAIDEANLTCTDTYTVTGHRVTLHGGDRVSWMYLARITPTASRLSVTARYIPAVDGETIWMWNTNTSAFDTTNPNSAMPYGSVGPSTTEANRAVVTASGGTVKNLCVNLITSPGAGASRAFAVSVAGTTGGTATVTFSAAAGMTCDTATGATTITSGDNIAIRQGVSGAAPTSSTASGGITIIPTTANRFMIPADTTGAMDSNNDRFLSLGATVQVITGTSAVGTALSSDVTFISAAGKLGGGAGAGNSYETTLRVCTATGTCADASSTFAMSLVDTTLVAGTGSSFAAAAGSVYSTRFIPTSVPNNVSGTVTYLLSMNSTGDVAPACASVGKYAFVNFTAGTTAGQITQALVNDSVFGEQNVVPYIPIVGAGAPFIFKNTAHIDFPGNPAASCVRPWNGSQSAVGMHSDDDDALHNIEFDFQGKLPETVTAGFYFKSNIGVADNGLNQDIFSLRGNGLLDFLNVALQQSSGNSILALETSDDAMTPGTCTSQQNILDLSMWVWVTAQKTSRTDGTNNRLAVYPVNQTTGAISGANLLTDPNNSRAPCNPDPTYHSKLGHHAVVGSDSTPNVHEIQFGALLLSYGDTPIFPLLPTSLDAASGGGTAGNLMLIHAGQ